MTDEQQMDTDGGFDRAAQRKALKHQFLRAAKRYCLMLTLPGGESQTGYQQDLRRARLVMIAAYADWRAIH